MGHGVEQPEERQGNRQVPPAFRDAWPQPRNRAEFPARGGRGKGSPDSGFLAVEPLYAFFLMDACLRFLQVSPVIAELSGYSLGELACMGLQEILALESMESTLAAFEQVDSLGWSHHTACIYRKDGVKAEARIDAIRLIDDQLLGWVREIRVQAGTSLRP